MRVDLLPEALTELHAAAVWYEEERVGLGGGFMHEVSDVLSRIGEAPTAFPRWPRTESSQIAVRKAPVRRFLIAYEIRGNLVRVLAVAHAKRRPLHWIDRLGRSAD